MAAHPLDIDWLSLERDYRAGTKSNRALASEYGVSEGAIRKRAKADGWIKGEPALVRSRALAKANDRALPRYLPPSEERIEALADVGADVIVRHRTMAATLAGLVGDMASQLRHQTDHEPDLAEQIEDFFAAKAAKNPLMAPLYKQQCNSALHAIGLNNRSKTMVNLTAAIGRLVDIERKAWNLDANTDNRSYEDLLAELHAKSQAQAA